MKSYIYQKTKHPDLFRIVDRNGDWKHYMHAPTNTVLRGVTTILDAGYAKGPFFEQYLLSKTKEESADILKRAGDRGDAVHQAIDGVLSLEEVPVGSVFRRENIEIIDRDKETARTLTDDEWGAFLAWGQFLARHTPLLICAEQAVYSLTHGYAGTLDAILVLTKPCGVKACGCEPLIGKIGLWDWKTSSGIRPSYSSQLAAYAHADNIADYLPPGKEIEYTAVCRIGTKHKTTGGYEIEAHEGVEVQNNFHRFLGCKMIADYEYAPFDPERDIVDIPDAITIEITKYQKPCTTKKKSPAIPANRPASAASAGHSAKGAMRRTTRK